MSQVEGTAPGRGRPARPGPAPTVLLVEGESDRIALRTLAARWGRDLSDHAVEIVPMGGITNLRAFVEQFGPRGEGRRLVGLYDAGEERVVRRQLAAGLATTDRDGPQRGRTAMTMDAPALPAAGFFRCDRDLEDELIRALGVPAVEAVIEAAGERRSLELLSRMPAQSGRPRVALVRRFLTSQSGRKARYAELLVAALPADRIPVPLRDVLARAGVTAP